MIFHPAVIALLSGSVLIVCMLVYSAFYGLKIIRHWDLRSGSELQLNLERRTYLISTLVSYGLGFQLLSLFLFIYTADELHTLFVGAMCAAGTLNVNGFGYPTILLKILNFLLAGLWLVVNRVDNSAYDYPLIHIKYTLLIVLTPLVLCETVIQACYFLEMEPAVITSCCGTLFSADIEGVTTGMVVLPRVPVQIAFFLSMAGTFASGIVFWLKERLAYLFSFLSLSTFILSILAIISFISLYFYELPTHHCPFCILQAEYHFVGYGLYAAFLAGAVSGLGVGVTMPFRKIPSLEQALPRIQRRLCLSSLLSYGLFLAITLWGMAVSNLKLVE